MDEDNADEARNGSISFMKFSQLTYCEISLIERALTWFAWQHAGTQEEEDEAFNLAHIFDCALKVTVNFVEES